MKIVLAAVLAASMLVAGVSLAGMPRYQIISLPIPDNDFIAVNDLNERGQITGATGQMTLGRGSSSPFLYSDGVVKTIETLSDDGNGASINDFGDVAGTLSWRSWDQHAFIYSKGVLTDLSAKFPAGTHSQAISISNARKAAGSLTLDPFGTAETHILVYSLETRKISDLGTLIGSGAFARQINSAGQIAGTYQQNGAQHVFLYSPKTHRAVDVAPGFVSFPANQPLNARGHVAGVFIGKDGIRHAYLYRDGRALDLGALGPTTINSGFVYALNNVDQLTGHLFTPDGHQRAFIYSGGRIRTLASANEAQESLGRAINDHGEVVGTADFLPFVFSRGKFRKLDLERFGAIAGDAVDINDAGQIIGNFTTPHPIFGYAGRAFLATPISLLYRNLWQDVRGRDARLAFDVLQAWTFFELERHRSTCNALQQFVQDVKTPRTRKHLGGLMPTHVLMSAAEIQEALECRAAI